MKARRLVATAGAVALIGLAVACSKDSTGPTDPFAGAWSVTVALLTYNTVPVDTGTVTPAPFTLTLTKGGTGQQPYLATWPVLTWALKTNGTALIPSSSQTGQTLTVSGDTLVITLPPPSWLDQTCQIRIAGTFNGQAAHGSVNIVGGNCGTLGADTGDGSWTATKQ